MNGPLEAALSEVAMHVATGVPAPTNLRRRLVPLLIAEVHAGTGSPDILTAVLPALGLWQVVGVG